jgi:hypothetical protein
MPAERLAGSARQRACESQSSELSKNNLKANFGELHKWEVHFKERYFCALRCMEATHSTDATRQIFCARASFFTYPFFRFRRG